MPISPADLESFSTHLLSSTRILAILGAGISASSGLPTFRGPGGLWRTFPATSLAHPAAFDHDPGFVWQFYSYRRHMALNARPNAAHYALVELARRKSQFLTLSQNVDGLSPRAGHPREQLKLVHGSLFDVKCVDEDGCGYVRRDDFVDPIVPALAIPRGAEAGFVKEGALIQGLDIADEKVPLPAVPLDELPHCPQCHTSLLRPGVVWFDEALPAPVLADIDAYISEVDPQSPDGRQKKIDLCLVIGTSSQVYPAAGYAQIARGLGAKVAVVNMDSNDANTLGKPDWFFQGDAAVIVPEILKAVTSLPGPST